MTLNDGPRPTSGKQCTKVTSPLSRPDPSLSLPCARSYHSKGSPCGSSRQAVIRRQRTATISPVPHTSNDTATSKFFIRGWQNDKSIAKGGDRGDSCTLSWDLCWWLTPASPQGFSPYQQTSLFLSFPLIASPGQSWKEQGRERDGTSPGAHSPQRPAPAPTY